MMIEGTEFFCHDADALVDASAIGIEHLIDRANALSNKFDKALPLCPFSYAYDMDASSQIARERFVDDIKEIRMNAYILKSVASELIDMCDGAENLIRVFDKAIENDK